MRISKTRVVAWLCLGGCLMLFAPVLLDYAWYGSRAALGMKPLSHPDFRSKRSYPNGSDPSFAYRKSMLRFPNAESCTDDSAERGVPPRRYVLAVGRIGNLEDLSVCAFRIMAKFSDIDAARDWMTAESLTGRAGGAPNVIDLIFFSRSVDQRRVKTPILSLQGYWSTSRGGFRFSERNPLMRMFSGLAYEVKVAAAWSDDGTELLWVRAGYMYL